jgi:hypothetical protein
MKFKKILFVLTTALVVLGSTQRSQAVLNAVDPGPYIADYGFFPVWYQDPFGLTLELCLSPATIAAGARAGMLGGPACTLLANPGIFDPAQPMVFPTNFPDESFYSMGDATIADAATGINLTYVANLEGAFGGGVPAANDQITFARIRIRADVPAAGTYTVTHPYGVEIFDVTTPGTKAINMTRDIGIGAPGVFTGALAGDVGPFLTDATVPVAGFIPGLNPATGLTEFFIGDPNTPRQVVGSPFGSNFVRIQGPGGIDVRTDLFTVMGKVFQGAPIATPLAIERSTYSRTTDLAGTVVAQQDVFVKTPPTSTVSYVDGNGATIPMTDADANGEWFGQSANDPVLPATVAVTADNSPANTPSTASSDLVDLITITRAEYTGGGTLVVEAVSSDEVNLPTLTVLGTPMTPTGAGVLQSATITGLTIPPARITVASINGGSDTEEVEVVAVP